MHGSRAMSGSTARTCWRSQDEGPARWTRLDDLSGADDRSTRSTRSVSRSVRPYAAALRRSQDGARPRAFALVRIPSADGRLDAYPRELSGGLRQRTMIAMSMSRDPRLLLADEPTTALDATVQAQVLILLRRLPRELGMGMIFVTHDRRHVCRAHRRDRAGRSGAEAAVASLRRRPSRFDRPRPAEGSQHRCDPRQPARSAPAAAGLQLYPPLLSTPCRLPDRGARTAFSDLRSNRCVL